jgi:hypothetical protein
MAEDQGAAPQDAHGFLHIGCTSLEIQVNAALAILANQIVAGFCPCKMLDRYFDANKGLQKLYLPGTARL